MGHDLACHILKVLKMIFRVDLFDYNDFILSMLRTKGAWDTVRHFEKLGGCELTVDRIGSTQHFTLSGLVDRVSLNPSDPIWLPGYDKNIEAGAFSYDNLYRERKSGNSLWLKSEMYENNRSVRGKNNERR